MKIDFLPVMCIIFLTMFLLVVIPTTKTFRGDIGDIMIIDSATTVNMTVKTDTVRETITPIQH